ncbi:MAG: DUF1538 domain-containing protein [Oscillospiraceae bacterium]|nr:DUF1538 domain-containing protein [Oscillospiraceae bacterium]
MKYKIKEQFIKKLSEAIRSILPVTALVLVLSFINVPMSFNLTVRFIIGSAFLIIGMALFTLGADVAMTPMGNLLGAFISKKGTRLWFIAAMGVALGFIITVTEPGLQVLANLADDIPTFVLVVTVAVGVGIFLAISFLREVLHFSFRYLLLFFYSLLFLLTFLVPKGFLSIAFDSGGATTGSMTVPFIMALGVGIALKQRTSGPKDDNFGLIAICSIGPILTVMILGLVYTPDGESNYAAYLQGMNNADSIASAYISALIKNLLETLILLAPIAAFFVIFNFITLKISKKKLIRIFKGLFYTFTGLVFFLTGANVGFLPAGSVIGHSLAESNYKWLLVVVGMIFGYLIISAEPAVPVLIHQVVEITKGTVSYKALKLSLSIGVALAIGISMFRVLTGLHIMWFLLPGYLISVSLAFIVPKIFTSIAFDSGGVVSGPLSSAFLLPIAIGASDSLGGSIVNDAFGLIAMVAMTPLVTVQIMGLYVTFLNRRKNKGASK